MTAHFNEISFLEAGMQVVDTGMDALRKLITSSCFMQLREQERQDILSQVTSEAERSRLEALFNEKRNESQARMEAMHSGTSTPRTSKPSLSTTAKRAHFNETIPGHSVAGNKANENQQITPDSESVEPMA